MPNRGSIAALSVAASLTAVSLLATGCGASQGSSSAKRAPSAPTAPASTAAQVWAPCLTAAQKQSGGVLLDVPASAGQTAEKVSAYVTGTGDAGIVLAHQAGENLCEWQSGQQELTAAGYRVMAISMVHHDDADVAAAVAELRKRGVKHVVLIGASRGGTAVLAGAALISPPVDGVVSLSGPTKSDQGVIADGVVPNLTTPLLFAAGTGDEPFFSDAKLMSQSAKPGVATLVQADSSAHGVSLYSSADTIHQAVLDFVKKHSS